MVGVRLERWCQAYRFKIGRSYFVDGGCHQEKWWVYGRGGRHEPATVLPSREKRPPAHLRHSPAPDSCLYVPARRSHVSGEEVLHRVSSSILGPVDPSFRALSGRLKFTVRRHEFNNDSLSQRHQDSHDTCTVHAWRNLGGQQMPSPRPWKMITYFHSTVQNPS